MDTDVAIQIIDNVRPRLRKLIEVDQVLDNLNNVDTEQKQMIRSKLQNEGRYKAADLLIDTVIRTKHAGWFKEFVDALSAGGCQHAADYVENNAPSPTLEEENDCCVRLVEILCTSLLEMKTSEVCLHCVTEGILTLEDKEIITARIETRGERSGARELLSRIVRFQPGWYSTFLKVLHETEHFDLYKGLTGESEVDDLKDGTKLPEEAAAALEEEATGGKIFVSPVDGTLDKGLPQSPVDLYNEEQGKNTATNCLDLSASGGSDITAAACAAPTEDVIALRDYQMEVARPALEGKNIIICLPTGSGKTRVAVYITKEHLDVRRRDKRPGKVVVLVNKVPLVEQHYTTEFWKFLKHEYRVERVSGDSQLKISFTEIVKKNDIIICTAQILENYLDRSKNGDDEGVRLTDLTLIVIDECHHTQKGGVYNHIMMRYLKQKHKNVRLEKEQKEPVPIPQILGLTASPGVGGANKMEKAEEHILRVNKCLCSPSFRSFERV